MNYRNEDITDRAKDSPFWDALKNQSGDVLPFMLERYLLLENWRYMDRKGAYRASPDEEVQRGPTDHDVQYLHTLLAEATTVLLSQEERIRKLEAMHQ